MNDDAMTERAHERLLTAELASVLASPRPTPLARGQRLYVAAMVMLGAFVAIGFAWLARDDRSPVQERGFDPVDPWYEHEWPWRSMAVLSKPRHDAELAAPTDEHSVTLRDEDWSDLAAVLDRPAVRRLAVAWRNDRASPILDQKAWERISARPELESLMLSGRFALPAESLRTLRLAPALRHVILIEGAVVLDVPTARALVELPRLRGLVLGTVDVSPDGLAALAGLPNLDALLLSRPRGDLRALMRAMPSLRTLRALVLENDGAIDAATLAPLAGMTQLRALDVSFGTLDDAALAALPPQLELFAFTAHHCTAAGLHALRRLPSLRTLRIRGMPAALRSALPEALRGLALERFDSLTDAPDPPTWQALQSLPKLRWLTFRRQGGPLADVVAGSVGCERLEVLELFEKRLPSPEDLAPLRDHPTLRRLVIRLDDPAAAAAPLHETRLAALRAGVRARLEVVGR